MWQETKSNPALSEGWQLCKWHSTDVKNKKAIEDTKKVELLGLVKQKEWKLLKKRAKSGHLSASDIEKLQGL